MPAADSPDPMGTIRFKGRGVFALGPDEVQFRTGSVSGPSCVVSDSEQRGLLATVIEKLLSSEGVPSRPWNESEVELLEEVIPQLQQNGIVEVDGRQPAPGGEVGSRGSMLRKPFAEARIAIVGHGVLGQAVRSLLRDTPCKSITMIESSSVARSDNLGSAGSSESASEFGAGATIFTRSLPRPGDSAQWMQSVRDHDWVIAAQDTARAGGTGGAQRGGFATATSVVPGLLRRLRGMGGTDICARSDGLFQLFSPASLRQRRRAETYLPRTGC